MLAISQVLEIFQWFEARHALFNDFDELEAGVILIGEQISTDGVSLTRRPPNDRRHNALFVDEDYYWPILQGLMNLNEVCACFAINPLDLGRE
jgi:hypothetical protein